MKQMLKELQKEEKKRQRALEEVKGWEQQTIIEQDADDLSGSDSDPQEDELTVTMMLV